MMFEGINQKVKPVLQQWEQICSKVVWNVICWMWGEKCQVLRIQNLEIPDFQDIISFKCIEFEFMKCLGARPIF